MRFTAGRSVPALIVSLCALIIATVLAAPSASAAQRNHRKAQPPSPTQTGEPGGSAPCQNHDRPPPPVDTSEEPKPGVPSPQPLPVPQEPVGGTRMGECGIIAPEATAPPAEITSASWVIADLDTGAVIAAKDPHARERPASLIKTLLAIVVIRELRQDEIVIGTQEDANQEGTKVGIGPAGKYTVKQLLLALLMHSGNDAAHALARQLGGVDAALAKMNTVAAELGALDTRAATPSGLDGPGMSTSAYDLSLIFRAAMKHKEFTEAVATRQIDFPGYGTKPGYKLNNDNKLLGKYPGFLGGKTGFTDDARHTYLGGAKQGKTRLSVVMLRGERNPAPLSDQGAKLLDYGFTLVTGQNKAVGQLVDHAPDIQSKPAEQVTGSGSAAPSSGEEQQPADHIVADRNRSAFGSFGVPLVIGAGVMILAGMVLWLRRQRAKAARRRANAIA